MQQLPIKDLLAAVRNCSHCQDLPVRPNPVVQACSRARLLVIGQAPGTRVHATGIPWNDASGALLRDWLRLAPEQFYDPEQVAIMPMGLCYPGKGKSGDLPPRSACAPRWHPPLLSALPNIRLTLLIGRYAQRYYLPDGKGNVSERVARHADYLPEYFPLPHPSPRNRFWLRQRPWFEHEVLPALRQEVTRALRVTHARQPDQASS